MKKKGVGFYFALLAAILGIAALVMVLSYGSKGGKVATYVVPALAVSIVCELLLLLGEKVWSDFAAIAAAGLFTYALMTVLSDGIWNIAESVSGIKMVGLPELAGMNFAIAGVNLAAVLFAVFASFSRKSREE